MQLNETDKSIIIAWVRHYHQCSLCERIKYYFPLKKKKYDKNMSNKLD